MNNKTIEIIGDKCYGCRVCESKCPFEAIKFKFDKEGFLIPTINNEKCTHCGLCLQNCPANKNITYNNFAKKYYGFSHPNQTTLIQSASGGFATYMSEKTIEHNGYVCGCIYSDDNEVIHIVSNKLNDIKKMQSSKYVQSNLKNVFKDIYNLLNNNDNVLFIGTPCQIHALNIFLNKEYNNLLTIDLICHGVPSPKSFDMFLKSIDNPSNIKLNFRAKENDDWGLKYKLETSRKITSDYLFNLSYAIDFLEGKNYRQCCYKCPFANHKNRPGDITIGDFWGIDKIKKDYNKKGVSCIIVNTLKGENYINKYSVELFNSSLEDIINNQHNLKSPTKKPNSRDTYFNKISINYFKRKQFIINVKKNIKKLLGK